MRFILAGSLLAGLNGRSVDLIARNGDARSRAGRPPSSDSAMVDAGAHRRMWRCELEVGGHRRRLGCHRRQWRCCSSTCAARSSRHRRMRRCSSEAKKNRLGVSEAASLHAVQGGRNRAGDQGGKPRGLMCSSATLAGFFDLSDASGPPWALLDLLLLFSRRASAPRCCCSSRGTVAKLAMRQPFVLFKGLTFQKTLLTGRISPGGSP